MKKVLLIALGSLCFGLGTLGIFIPFLPTTGFYLLAGFCWVRSSEKLYQGLVTSNNYQRFVKKPILERKISNWGMVRMFLMMLLVFLIPIILVDNLLVKLVVGFVYLCHVVGLTYYLRGRGFVKESGKEIVDE